MSHGKYGTVVAMAFAALLGMSLGHADVIFQEEFERGEPPFGFDGQQPAGGTAVGRLVDAGAQRGRVWEIQLPVGPQPGPVGHRLILDDASALGGRLHWAGYVRFGSAPGSYWQPDGVPFALQLPVIADGNGEPLLTGWFRLTDRRGLFGTFELETADGRRHRPLQGRLLAAGRWYAIEFGVEDHGEQDRLRIWIDNDDVEHPDYELSGSDLIDSGRWRQGLRMDLGVLPQALPAERRFAYGAITLATDFIGLPVRAAPRPAAPGRLQVQ